MDFGMNFGGFEQNANMSMNMQVTDVKVNGQHVDPKDANVTMNMGMPGMTMNVSGSDSNYNDANVAMNMGVPGMTMNVSGTDSNYNDANVTMNVGMPGISMNVSGTDPNFNDANVTMNMGVPGISMNVSGKADYDDSKVSMNIGVPGISMNVAPPKISVEMPKICKIDTRNKIWVELVSQNGTGYYVGGDVVYGKVHLNCIVPFSCNGIILKVKGKEAVFFQETISKHDDETNTTKTTIVDHKDEKIFFDQTLVPYPTGGLINPGQYEYPFEYQLPIDLPGCLKLEGGDKNDGSKYKAKIEYKLIATVDVNFAHDLKGKTRLVINEKFDKALKPASKHDCKKFMGGATLDCNLELNKNAYFAGERVLARLVANSNSTKETRKIKCQVIHKVVLRADGHKKELSFTESRSDRSGFSPCFYGVKYLQFSIPYNLPPTVNSPHISSEYKIVLTCDIPNAIDLDISVPVLILAPQFVYSTTPPVQEDLPPPPDVSFRPPWDLSRNTCAGCGVKFSLFKRQHHCRHCGKQFCDKCLPHTYAMKNLGYEKPERVCEACSADAQAGGKIYQNIQGNF